MEIQWKQRGPAQDGFQSFYITVRPRTGPAKATLLLCHGWTASSELILTVAQILAARCNAPQAGSP